MTILAKDGSQINTYNEADKETKGQNYKIFSIHKKKTFTKVLPLLLIKIMNRQGMQVIQLKTVKSTKKPYTQHYTKCENHKCLLDS